MRLGMRQEIFTDCMAKLILFVNATPGYACRIRDVRSPRLHDAIEIITDSGDPRSGDVVDYLNGFLHKKLSEHESSTGFDLPIFFNSKYLIDTDDYKFAGDYWESLHAICRWGGRYNDGNHFECLEWR